MFSGTVEDWNEHWKSGSTVELKKMDEDLEFLEKMVGKDG